MLDHSYTHVNYTQILVIHCNTLKPILVHSSTSSPHHALHSHPPPTLTPIHTYHPHPSIHTHHPHPHPCIHTTPIHSHHHPHSHPSTPTTHTHSHSPPTLIHSHPPPTLTPIYSHPLNHTKIDTVNDRVKMFIAKLEADNLRRQTAAAISEGAIEEMKAAIRRQHQKAAVSAKSEEYKATRSRVK